ncbi:MAG TPA: hypothetical protein VGR37_16710 [Longimicrobiaceae bacterium]|nr:hypothetical protein [Longimicrobiaceae bacterium]
MTRKKKTAPSRGPSELEQARNDLFGHIHRCGVLRATEEQQEEWMSDTLDYLAECYPSLGEDEIQELRTIGLRFCRPVIDNVAPADEDESADDVDGAGEEEIAASAA